MSAYAPNALMRVKELERAAGELVTPLGIAELPNKPVYLARPETEAWDWIVLRLADDPVFRAGELAIPRDVRRHLAELERRGATFDELLVAHEVPRGSALAAKSATGWELDLLTSVSKARVERATNRLDRALGVLAGAARATAGSFASGIGSDPVLIGTIRISDDKAGRHAWFVLAAWDL